MIASHVHINGVIINAKTDCMHHTLRYSLSKGLASLVSVVYEEMKLAWKLFEGSTVSEGFLGDVLMWVQSILRAFVADIDRLHQFVDIAQQQDATTTTTDGTPYIAYDDGRFFAIEALRRTTFNAWFLDKGLARFLLRNVFQPGDVIADFGAGGGHYSQWFNDTGLVTAYAFEGTPEIGEITEGAVINKNLLDEPLVLPTWAASPDWVMCIEVGEHIPPEGTNILIDNINRYAGKGAIITWSSSAGTGIHHINALPLKQWIGLVESRTGMHVNQSMTEELRASSDISWIKESATVFVRTTDK
eukprot:GHVS01086598.1.p1 GENE.GHVS01086598.1~~GHVS01086598.1.p1  ORF type:complete len:342 (-),score=42.04 GHVS01086598.1:296-1201(-)